MNNWPTLVLGNELFDFESLPVISCSFQIYTQLALPAASSSFTNFPVNHVLHYFPNETARKCSIAQANFYNKNNFSCRWFIRRPAADAQHLPRVREESSFQFADPDGMQTESAVLQRLVAAGRAFGLQRTLSRDVSHLSDASDPALHHHFTRNISPHSARARRATQFGERPRPVGAPIAPNARRSI